MLRVFINGLVIQCQLKPIKNEEELLDQAQSLIPTALAKCTRCAGTDQLGFMYLASKGASDTSDRLVCPVFYCPNKSACAESAQKKLLAISQTVKRESNCLVLCTLCKKQPAPGATFILCPDCNVAGYCSSTCQQADLKEHRTLCMEKPRDF